LDLGIDIAFFTEEWKELEMDENILIAYASKYGATQEIAVKIGEVLRQAGLKVEVLPVTGIRDLKPYSAVILGSAIYIGNWPKEAVAFVQTHEKTLADRPVWLFSSGPTGEGDPVKLVDGWRLPAAVQPSIDRIKPCDTVIFHGWINPQKINRIEKWAVQKLVKKPFGDFRDWTAITAWAASIATALKLAEPQTVG
jgi:menaquinone-dependent protoporphyrinogen oxidase